MNLGLVLLFFNSFFTWSSWSYFTGNIWAYALISYIWNENESSNQMMNHWLIYYYIIGHFQCYLLPSRICWRQHKYKSENMMKSSCCWLGNFMYVHSRQDRLALDWSLLLSPHQWMWCPATPKHETCWLPVLPL